MTPEDEQLEQIKEWWKEYRWTILGGTALGIGVIGGWTGWNEYTKSEQEAASELYQQVSVAVVRDNNYQIAKEATDELVEDHSSTGYAGNALLLLARSSFENDEVNQARSYLEQAMNMAQQPATVHAARIRLAQLMIVEKEYDEAIALLDVPAMQGFDSHYYELTGDAFRALGQTKEAHEAYRDSMDALSPESQYQAILALKLNDTFVRE